MTTPPPDRRAGRLRRNPVLGAGLGILVVLVLAWPFVREPPLGLLETYLCLFATWAGAILLSAWLSRGVAGGKHARGPP